MEEEKYFDYSRGLNAPYWIQEIKTQKGKVIWYFSTPMKISYFVVFFYCFNFIVNGIYASNVIIE